MTLASVAGHSHEIWFWDLTAGRLKDKVPHSQRVTALAFATVEESILAYSDSSGWISLLDLATLQQSPLMGITRFGHWREQVIFMPGSNLLAARGHFGSLSDS